MPLDSCREPEILLRFKARSISAVQARRADRVGSGH
jgi:hypothetical protein